MCVCDCVYTNGLKGGVVIGVAYCKNLHNFQITDLLIFSREA